MVSHPQARPVLSMAHGTRSAPDKSARPVNPSMLMCLMRCQAAVGCEDM